MCLLSGLSIHEVPRHAEAQDAVVERVAGRQEGCTAESGIHVAHHDEEAGALEVHVHVDVDDGVVAQLHVVLAVLLDAILQQLRTIVGSGILGEEAHVAAQIDGEHPGYLEVQVEVAVDVQVGDGQHVLLAALLVGDHRLPVQRTEREVLAELECEQADVARMLVEGDLVTGALFAVHRVLMSEVYVVLQVVYGHAQACPRLLVPEQTLDAGARLFLERVVPPKVPAVVAALEEGGVQQVVVSAGHELHRVAEELEVEVGCRIHLQLSGILAQQPSLGRHVVVEQGALRLAQLTAHTEVVLVVFAESARRRVGDFEVSQVRRDEAFQPRLRPFVETLEKRDGERVLQFEELHLVVDAVRLQVFLQGVCGGVEALRCGVGLVDALVAVELRRVDEAGHGYVFVLHELVFLGLLLVVGQQTVGHLLAADGHAVACFLLHVPSGFVAHNLRIVGPSGEGFRLLDLPPFLLCLLGSLRFLVLCLRSHRELLRLDFLFGHRHLAVEADVVAVREEHVDVIVAVPRLTEPRGDFVQAEVGLVVLGVGHVVVVGDTAVLGYLLVVGREEQVSLIAVAEIGTVEREVEVRRALILVVSAGVNVVELEAEAQLLVGVDGEVGLEAVLTVDIGTAREIRQVGERRVGVGEVELVDWLDEVVERLQEHELLGLLAVDENAVQARRAEVPRGVVFASFTRREDVVHEHVLQGVGFGRPHVAKALIDRPHLDALHHLLAAAFQRVAAQRGHIGIRAVFVALGDGLRLRPHDNRRQERHAKPEQNRT